MARQYSHAMLGVSRTTLHSTGILPMQYYPKSIKTTLNRQALIEKNSLGIGNVNMFTTIYVLGYYTLYRLLTFRSKLDINLLFCFQLQY